MKPLVLLNIVGLSQNLLGKHTPNLNRFLSQGQMSRLVPILPAVTCSIQATILTGKKPCHHGIVGNGWYFRDLAEVLFWRQSNHLVEAPKFWDEGKKKRNLKVAKLFWWYNMYSTADIAVTPRPSYHADGRKIPDIYTEPPELRAELTKDLGPFPLFHFWGPLANILSSEWIARSARAVFEKEKPDVSLIYLPHLDYNLQRLGPQNPAIFQDVEAIDVVAGELIDFFLHRDCHIVILSEYGISPVSQPVHLNRILRKEGYLRVQHNYTGELLDCGASRAFAVADHQIAHVYVARREDLPSVKKLLESIPGVEQVLDQDGKREVGLDHPRSGELVVVSRPESWFTYYYWEEDGNAPDFARTVDIHRKPGYDPAELFFDPKISFLKLKLLKKLGAKKLGFRTLLDVIPLQAELVKGSHGRIPKEKEESPLLITNISQKLPSSLLMTDLFSLFLELL